MVKLTYDHERDMMIVTICGSNVEVVYDAPSQPSDVDKTPDGLPLIVLAA